MLFIGHLALAKLAVEKLDIDDPPMYFLGAIIPDIRYYIRLPREQTHPSLATLESIAQGVDEPSFVLGFKTHLIIDELEEEEDIHARMQDRVLLACALGATAAVVGGVGAGVLATGLTATLGGIAVGGVVGTVLGSKLRTRGGFPAWLDGLLRPLRRVLPLRVLKVLVDAYYHKTTKLDMDVAGRPNRITEALQMNPDDIELLQVKTREFLRDPTYENTVRMILDTHLAGQESIQRYMFFGKIVEKTPFLKSILFWLSGINTVMPDFEEEVIARVLSMVQSSAKK